MDANDESNGMDAYHVRHDWGSDVSVSRTVIDAITTMAGDDAADLETLDMAALDQLFAPSRESTRRDGNRVEIAVARFRITVAASGDITVRRDGRGETRATPTSAAAFRAALSYLIRTAEASGLDVEGGWACEDDSGFPNWGIEIYEVV
jgi:hypothetical protein